MDTPVSKTPQFMIIPTGYSATSSVIIVLVLFILYMIFIGYIACYKLKFYPNMFMFWNFMTSGNDTEYQTEFENYIRTVMADTNAQITNSGVISPSKTESFVSGDGILQHKNTDGRRPSEFVGKGSNNPRSLAGDTLIDGNPMTDRLVELQPLFRSWYNNAQMTWNKIMLKSFVHGKTIKVARI